MSIERVYQLHPVHRLIQVLGRNPEVQQQFARDREAVFTEFGISDEEAAALKNGSIAALASIGVNPVLRMHWLMISNPSSASFMSVTEYLPKILAGASHG